MVISFILLPDSTHHVYFDRQILTHAKPSLFPPPLLNLFQHIILFPVSHYCTGKKLLHTIPAIQFQQETQNFLNYECTV